MVVYDYGMGGLWAVVTADSAEAIVRKFPELAVVSDRPSWMNDEIYERLDKLDLDADVSTGVLGAILADRTHE